MSLHTRTQSSAACQEPEYTASEVDRARSSALRAWGAPARRPRPHRPCPVAPGLRPGSGGADRPDPAGARRRRGPAEHPNGARPGSECCPRERGGAAHTWLGQSAPHAQGSRPFHPGPWPGPLELVDFSTHRWPGLRASVFSPLYKHRVNFPEPTRTSTPGHCIFRFPLSRTPRRHPRRPHGTHVP